MDTTRPPPRVEHAAPDWRHYAACRDVDPELFHPKGREDSIYGQLQIAQAKVVCRRCPVTTECLEWAFQIGDKHAVLGGKSVGERRALRRANATRSAPVDRGVAGKSKRCGSCDTVKSVAEFTSHASRSDGLASRCKDCDALARQQQRLQGPGQHRPRRKAAV